MIIIAVVILLRNLFRDGIAETAKKPVDAAKKMLLKAAAKNAAPTPADDTEKATPPAEPATQPPAQDPPAQTGP